jgi:hypothetical protein
MLGEGVGGYSPSGGTLEPRCCESAGQPDFHVPRFHRMTLSQERRKFPQQDRIASAACCVAVIRIESAGFSRRSVMAIKPSLDLLKARAYRLKQALGGPR